MDPLDIKIIRKLHAGGRSEYDPFPTSVNSLRKVASDLAIDKNAVKKRLERLVGERIFLGWSAMINPGAISLTATRVWLRFANEGDKDKATKELSGIREIRAIMIYHGDTISLIFVHHDRNALEDTLKELEKKVGAFDKVRESIISFPECARTLSTNDYKLYEAIRNSFERPQAGISDEVGLSLRTVKRKFGELTESKSILLVSGWNPKRIEGVALELYVRCSSAEALAKLTSKISSRLDDSLTTVEPYEDSSSGFYFITRNIHEANDCSEFVKSQAESIHVDLHLILDTVIVRERLRLR